MNGTSSSELCRATARPHASDRQPQAAQVAHAGDRRRLRPAGTCSRSDAGAQAAASARTMRQHGQRRAAHLEERLRRQEEDAQAASVVGERKRSASIAAMQPLPAAVTAWR